MKKCVVIINPNSGKGFSNKNLEKMKKILLEYGYDSEIVLTEYRLHATEITKKLDDNINLLISVGGDGTFSEVMNGNLLRNKKLVLAHLPVGTTNDIGHMYGLGNNLFNNLRQLLEGKIKGVDIGTINNHAFTYVASYGKFMDIPYQTPQELKKMLGYTAYVIEVLKRVFNRIPRYEVEFTIDDKKHLGKYTFIIVSNANRIGGIDNFYNDIKLNDNKFEVMFCSLTKKTDILKAIYALKTSNIESVAGIEIYKCSNLKIEFKDKNKPWCVDGEKYAGDDTYQFGIINDVKMLIPTKNIDKLFI